MDFFSFGQFIDIGRIFGGCVRVVLDKLVQAFVHNQGLFVRADGGLAGLRINHRLRIALVIFLPAALLTLDLMENL